MPQLMPVIANTCQCHTAPEMLGLEKPVVLQVDYARMHGYELHFSASNIEANATVRPMPCACRARPAGFRHNFSVQLDATLSKRAANVAPCCVQGVFNKESMIMKMLQEASLEEVRRQRSAHHLELQKT